MFKEEAFFCSCQFDHENLLRYFESKKNATKYKKNGDEVKVSYIIQEYIQGEELFKYLQKTGGFSEEICRNYFTQMLQGLNYLHSNKNLCHRDLNPRNILVDENENFGLKIVDYGFMCRLQGEDGSGVLTKQAGTPVYMAPEILKEKY